MANVWWALPRRIWAVTTHRSTACLLSQFWSSDTSVMPYVARSTLTAGESPTLLMIVCMRPVSGSMILWFSVYVAPPLACGLRAVAAEGGGRWRGEVTRQKRQRRQRRPCTAV